MRLILKLALCLLVEGSVSAMPTMVNAAVKTFARRAPVWPVIESVVPRLKADWVIATEEVLGPRDPFVFPKILTLEEEEFEKMLMRRRLEQGLDPAAVKR